MSLELPATRVLISGNGGENLCAARVTGPLRIRNCNERAPRLPAVGKRGSRGAQRPVVGPRAGELAGPLVLRRGAAPPSPGRLSPCRGRRPEAQGPHRLNGWATAGLPRRRRARAEEGGRRSTPLRPSPSDEPGRADSAWPSAAAQAPQPLKPPRAPLGPSPQRRPATRPARGSRQLAGRGARPTPVRHTAHWAGRRVTSPLIGRSDVRHPGGGAIRRRAQLEPLTPARENSSPPGSLESAYLRPASDPPVSDRAGPATRAEPRTASEQPRPHAPGSLSRRRALGSGDLASHFTRK
ncbi:translation initiation factor IF-2 [Symphalangus syndactylus]|uniref:translation initiation factor IF-2 n=1 Tax=Symphalangus syndactylus TaxID=9590 RepID=UPI003004D7EA